MTITIIGTGYVGLVTGACFADIGVRVNCVDINKEKIEALNKGISPIYEPGLNEILQRNIDNGRLTFHTDLDSVLNASEVVFIAVGTPPGEDGSADLKYVLDVANQIGEKLTDYILVVTKSTVPIGTSKRVKDAISGKLLARNKDIRFDVASNPEFLKEGAAINDFKRPDRIVVGVENMKSKQMMEKLYKPFVINGHPLLFMDVASAEMTKYAANAMLATKISFMNDIANLCEKIGANVNSVRRGIGTDSRIGDKFIYPGIGYGGSCFPKDVKALVQIGEENEYRMRVIESVEAVNNSQKSIIFEKLFKHFNGNIRDKVICLWGLSFKPNTDDMREAPSIVISNLLLSEKAKIQAYDPVAKLEAKEILGSNISYCKNYIDAAIGADAIILITEWEEFRLPDWDKIKSVVNSPTLFDGRNLYEREALEANGFIYFGIGN